MQWKSSLHVRVKFTPWHAHAGTQGWRSCSSNPLATRHLEGGGWSAPRCVRLAPGIAPVPIVEEAGRASWTAPQISLACYVECHIRFQVSAGGKTFSAFSHSRALVRSQTLWFCNARTATVTWSRAGVGNLLVVLCRSNVAKSLSVPTHPSPPYFCIQQPLKHVNLILSKLSFWRDIKTGIALKELYDSI